MTELLDARGVEIAPGDTVIYGFSVGRSIAMAEAVVMAETKHVDNAAADECPGCATGDAAGHLKVSLTPSGRVRLRIIRRSYSSSEKQVVDVAPDRLVVLKPIDGPGTTPALPGSPLPTQDEANRREWEEQVGRHTEGLRATVTPRWWEGDLLDYHTFCARQLKELREKLKELEDQ